MPVAEIHPRVVVIDDEPLVRWSIVAGLRHAGIDAVGAADLEEGRPLARAADLVLLDVSVWPAGSHDILADLRALAPSGRVIILAVEGQPVPPATRGDLDVIRKPFDLNDVVERVRRAMPEPSHDVRMAM
jgi:DNA-binding response OmpR family regulator